jgi:uncharacterized membrane protein
LYIYAIIFFFFYSWFLLCTESPFTFLFLGLAMGFLDLSWRMEQKDVRYVKKEWGME